MIGEICTPKIRQFQQFSRLFRTELTFVDPLIIKFRPTVANACLPTSANAGTCLVTRAHYNKCIPFPMKVGQPDSLPNFANHSPTNPLISILMEFGSERAECEIQLEYATGVKIAYFLRWKYKWRDQDRTKILHL